MKKITIVLVLLAGLIVLLYHAGPVSAASRALAHGNPAAGRSTSRPAKQVSSKDQADRITSATLDLLWQSSDSWYHQGDYPRAIAIDRLVTAGDPHFVEGYCNAAWLLEGLRRTKEAEALYKEGIRANPEASEIYYTLGMLYYNHDHNYPAAIAVYKKDTTLKSANVTDWKMLAHSYEKAHDMPRALATWKKILARWPNGPAVKLNYDRVVRQMSGKSKGISAKPTTPAGGRK